MGVTENPSKALGIGRANVYWALEELSRRHRGGAHGLRRSMMTFGSSTSWLRVGAPQDASTLVRTDQQKSWDFSWAFGPDSWAFDPFRSALSRIGYLARHSILCRKLLEYLGLFVLLLATPAGIEPATFSLEGCCSIR
jgi:hypothetical protein